MSSSPIGAGSSARLSASSASSRTTESIVPSTGRRTALYAASDAPRSARAASFGSTPFADSASTSAAPRTIWERITPELPRAPMSAARVTSCASAGRSAASEPPSASATARTVSVRFVPVSPSGTG